MPAVKVCGLRTEQDALLINQYQIEYAGLVMFYEKSKRNVVPEQAENILKVLSGNVKRVAVCVSPDSLQVQKMEGLGFDILQIHGELSKEVLKQIKLPIWRAYHMDGKVFVREENRKICGYVYDGAKAGSGECFHWENLQGISRKDKLFILAGGLNAENVREGIKCLKPDVVDVSTGVEKKNKVGKSSEKLRAFVDAVRREV